MPFKQEQPTGKEAYQLWWSRIHSCVMWRYDYWNGDRNWDRAYRQYKGIEWEDRDDYLDEVSSDNPREKITVHMTASTVNTMLPFLVNRRPKAVAKPRKPQGTVSAMIQEEVLNYEYEHRDMHPQMKRAVKDMAIIGWGVIKTGFTLKLDEASNEKSGDINYEDYVADEACYVKRVCPKDFYFDPNASERNLSTARYCFERYRKYVADVLVNTSYKESVRKKIKSGEYKLITSNVEPDEQRRWWYDDDLGLSDMYINPENELATLYELWDKKYNKYYVFAEGVPEPLVEKDNPYPYLKGEFPYRIVQFEELPDEWYPIGICGMIEDQTIELNRHRTFAYHHRRILSARKYEVLEGIDDEEADKLAAAEDGTYIKVPQIGSIKLIEDAQLPKDYFPIEATIKGDIQETVGLDALMRGGDLGDRTTAGEVGTRVNLFSYKLNDRVDAVDDFFLKTMYQLNAHIGANYLKESVVRLIGPQGEFWVRYSNKDLRDEIILTLETVSAPKTDPNIERNQRIQILGIMMQALQVMVQTGVPIDIDFNEVFRWVLESFGRKDIARFFRSAANPIDPTVLEPKQLMTRLRGGNPAQEASDFEGLFKRTLPTSTSGQPVRQLGA